MFWLKEKGRGILVGENDLQKQKQNDPSRNRIVPTIREIARSRKGGEEKELCWLGDNHQDA